MVRAIPVVVMALESVHGHRREIWVIEELNSSVIGRPILSKSDAEVLPRYVFIRSLLRCAPYENRMATGCLIVCCGTETISRIVACRWIYIIVLT